MGRYIEITPGACILGALTVLVLPLRWVLGALTAAAVHELWHWGAVRLCGGDVYCLRIGAAGAVMETGPMSRSRELLCAAAGPLGSLSLLLVIRVLPVTALCGLIQGLFNLLPLYPLDGGRILRSGLEMILAKGTERRIECLIAGTAGLFCLWIALRLGWMAVMGAGFLMLRGILSKNTLQRIQSGGTIGDD